MLLHIWVATRRKRLHLGRVMIKLHIGGPEYTLLRAKIAFCVRLAWIKVSGWVYGRLRIGNRLDQYGPDHHAH
jgi:hypothetical protein